MKFYVNAPKLLLILCLLLGLGGCTYLSSMIGIGPEMPKAKLNSVEVSSLSFDKIELQVKVDVYNPNSFDLELQRVDYTIKVLKRELSRGTFRAAQKFPANSQSSVVIPVTLKVDAVFDIFEKYLRDPKSLSVHVAGEVEVKTFLGSWVVPFEDERNVLKHGSKDGK